MNNWYWVEPHSSGSAKVAVKVDTQGLNDSQKEEVREELDNIVEIIRKQTSLNVPYNNDGYPDVFDGGDYFIFWIS